MSVMRTLFTTVLKQDPVKIKVVFYNFGYNGCRECTKEICYKILLKTAKVYMLHCHSVKPDIYFNTKMLAV